jgi:hypothetical protein
MRQNVHLYTHWTLLDKSGSCLLCGTDLIITKRGKELLPALNDLSKWSEEQLKLDKPKLNEHMKVSL